MKTSLLSLTAGVVFTVVLVCLPATGAEPGNRSDLLLADFEGTNYGTWKATGNAFGPGPAHGTLPNQMPVEGFQGQGLVNSYYGGDSSTGTLTSARFTIDRRSIRFLIGGGGYAGKTCLNLLVDNIPVRTATGPNTEPGGSERLAWQGWDVAEFAGKNAALQIVDAATGGWGHINVDQIMQTDRPPPKVLTNLTRELVVEKRYLNLPVKNGTPQRWVSLLVDGRPTREFQIELAEGEPDWWAFVDLDQYKRRRMTIQIDRLDSTAPLRRIRQSDQIEEVRTLYHEPLRPGFHFSSRRGWNNDPNGLVFYAGEYHLFYQHNPYGWNWGNMHWGHAISRDLVRWEELDDALVPDELGPIFSGSGVVDWKSTSGFGDFSRPPIVLIYTAAGGGNRLSQGKPFTQCLAFSEDRGRTFQTYTNNPVLPNITAGNRDPKVFWYKPANSWIMTLYVQVTNSHAVQFFSSPNLREWTFLSQNEGFYECPDFFALPIEGHPAERRWVLTAANSEYQIGNFDGTTFIADTPKLKGHLGTGFYAAQTFSDIPGSDGRRIQIGWLQAATPGMPFNQAMSIPLELKLLSTPDGPRLAHMPARELVSLRASSWQRQPFNLEPGEPNPLGTVKGELVELRTEFSPGEALVTLTVRGATITYDPKAQELTVNRLRAPAPLRDGVQRLVIYCDRTALEVFASDGLTYIPLPFTPKPDDRSLRFEASGGSVLVTDLAVHELGSCWNR